MLANIQLFQDCSYKICNLFSIVYASIIGSDLYSYHVFYTSMNTIEYKVLITHWVTVRGTLNCFNVLLMKGNCSYL